ncbi:hypothetical protein BH10PSE2_BH10PSE2_30730 [soil metagenome]
MRGLVRLAAAGLVGLVGALWTWTAPGNPAFYPVIDDQPAIEVALLDNGFHTDLVVPRTALEADGGPLAEASRGLGPGDWVLIGWGDARFYVDQRPIRDRLLDGARAFFRPGNPSVVMLDPEQLPPMQAFVGNRRLMRLSPGGFLALRDRIQASLALRNGHPVIAAARAGDEARFFASRETFWIGNLCNHWTARVLNAAGLPMRPLRAATSAEVMAGVDRASASPDGPALHSRSITAR